MNKTKFHLLIVLIFIAGIFVGCERGNKNTETDIDIAEDVQEFVYPIPTPFEITQMLQNSGVAYVAELVNSPKKVDEYLSEKSQALNLGVYGSDLSYSSTYNNAALTRELLATSKVLSDNLGITTMFNQNLMKRVENNLENTDSIYKIVSNSYYDTFNFLYANEKGPVAIMILAGGWIEGIYLSTQLASLSENNEEVLKGIAQQKFTIKELIKLLSNYPENKDVVEVLVIVEKFNEIFKKVEQKDDDLFISPQLFDELFQHVSKVRTEIVEAS